MSIQTQLTRYFAVAPPPPIARPRGGARAFVGGVRKRLQQALLSQFFPNPGMWIGEIGTTAHLESRRLRALLMNPKYFPPAPRNYHRVPQTKITEPLPFPTPTTDEERQANAHAIFRQAAAAAEPLKDWWNEDYNGMWLVPTFLPSPD